MYILKHKRKPCKLALEDGRVFAGLSFGAEGTTTGEAVFNTGMSGYQEILTDPSYKGQIVTMTYPLIGNYGFNLEDLESKGPMVEGFVVREASRLASNWRSSQPLEELLAEKRVIGIEDVDTRALTLHLRDNGAMRAVISTETLDDAALVDIAKAAPQMDGCNLADVVSCKEAYDFEQKPTLQADQSAMNITVYDFGVKKSILRQLASVGFNVHVVPSTTPAETVLAAKPDAVMFSNGPGDPEPVSAGIAAAKEIVGKLPVMGICLGHQIMGIALGGRTYKLLFGHHGSNHPVMDMATRRIQITAQNHGFCVDAESLSAHGAEITHLNLNDQTTEGLKIPDARAFSLQFHPEAGPGPNDACGVFTNFAQEVRRGGA